MAMAMVPRNRAVQEVKPGDLISVPARDEVVVVREVADLPFSTVPPWNFNGVVVTYGAAPSRGVAPLNFYEQGSFIAAVDTQVRVWQAATAASP